jgi:hypothetical protein
VGLTENKAVTTAYETGSYVDAKGQKWRRGMDGWFLDNVDGQGGVMLVRHHHMVQRIELEHPDE